MNQGSKAQTILKMENTLNSGCGNTVCSKSALQERLSPFH